MKPYEKTFNLYARHKDKPNIGKYNTEMYYAHEFTLVHPMAWRYTDKIDGTNIRIVVRRNQFDGAIQWDVEGRKANSQIPGDLKAAIDDMMLARVEKFNAAFGQHLLSDQGVTLYGEGYGPGIQKNGGQYRDTKGFILFDIAEWHAKLDTDTQKQSVSQFYLPFDGVQSLAERLDIQAVPELFRGSGLPAVVKGVREGFLSLGGRPSEGIVASAPGLFYHEDGALRRMKFKLKTKDFVR